MPIASSSYEIRNGPQLSKLLKINFMPKFHYEYTPCHVLAGTGTGTKYLAFFSYIYKVKNQFSIDWVCFGQFETLRSTYACVVPMLHAV